MGRKMDCPTCGAQISFSAGASRAECYACGTAVSRLTESSGAPVSSSNQKLALVGVAVTAALVLAGSMAFFLVSKSVPYSETAHVSASFPEAAQPPSPLQFGGPGTGSGFFLDPVCIAADGMHELFVGEGNTGSIQVFDMNGVFQRQWSYASPEEHYLRAAAADHNTGRLYLVYDSELHIHSGETGEHLGNLRHPDGWGFVDVDVFPDGHVAASWYKNRDDVLVFSPEGELVLHIPEAVSGIAGSSELSPSVAAGNLNEFYVHGSFCSIVAKYDQNGVLHNRFGDDDLFTMTSGMVVDPAGRLWISDFGDLLLFSSTGRLLETVSPGISVNDFVITPDWVLYGITSNDTVLILDLNEYR
jgi:hypothetical protein